MPRLKAAVIGAGAIAQHCHLPGYQRHGDVDLAAIAEIHAVMPPAKCSLASAVMPGTAAATSGAHCTSACAAAAAPSVAVSISSSARLRRGTKSVTCGWCSTPACSP